MGKTVGKKRGRKNKYSISKEVLENSSKNINNKKGSKTTYNKYGRIINICNEIGKVLKDVEPYDFYRCNEMEYTRFVVSNCVIRIFNCIANGKDISDIAEYSINNGKVYALFKLHLKDKNNKHIALIAYNTKSVFRLEELSEKYYKNENVGFILLNDKTKEEQKEIFDKYNLNGDTDKLVYCYKNNSAEKKNRKLRHSNIGVCINNYHLKHIIIERIDRMGNCFKNISSNNKMKVLKSALMVTMKNYDTEVVWNGKRDLGKNTLNENLFIPIFIKDRVKRNIPDFVVVANYKKSSNTINLVTVYNRYLILKHLALLPYSDRKWVKNLKKSAVASSPMENKKERLTEENENNTAGRNENRKNSKRNKRIKSNRR